MPYQDLDERMDRLETVLTTFIRHADETIVEIRRDIGEMRQWRIQAEKRWGELAQKLGKFVEDMVAPNIPRIARVHFGLGGTEEEMFSAPRVRLRHPGDKSRMREFDYVFAGKEGWIIVGSRNDPKLRDVDEFREVLAEANEYFPQYGSLRLYPIFASLYLPEHLVQYCTRHRIYALGMGTETMQLLNASEITPPTTK